MNKFKTLAQIQFARWTDDTAINMCEVISLLSDDAEAGVATARIYAQYAGQLLGLSWQAFP